MGKIEIKYNLVIAHSDPANGAPALPPRTCGLRQCNHNNRNNRFALEKGSRGLSSHYQLLHLSLVLSSRRYVFNITKDAVLECETCSVYNSRQKQEAPVLRLYSFLASTVVCCPRHLLPPSQVVLDLDETLVCAYNSALMPAELQQVALRGAVTTFTMPCQGSETVGGCTEEQMPTESSPTSSQVLCLYWSGSGMYPRGGLSHGSPALAVHEGQS